MAKSDKVKPIQTIFEARYEGGYRYLDRCGDTMLILEDILLQETEHSWLPSDMQPTGARMKCPDLDVNVTFDARRLAIDQTPVDRPCDFDRICRTVFDTIKARFDFRSLTRLGARRIGVLATDSIEEAEELTLKVKLIGTFPERSDKSLKPASLEAGLTFENDDHSVGVKLKIAPAHKIGAQLEADPRLSMHPRFLPKGQHEALIGQLKRASVRETNPDVGLILDFDYYWVMPGEGSLDKFFKNAWQEMDALTKSLRGFE